MPRRWDNDDDERLPEGMVRIGYDADTQIYTFRDADGSLWEGEPGCRYGKLHRVSAPTPTRTTANLPSTASSPVEKAEDRSRRQSQKLDANDLLVRDDDERSSKNYKKKRASMPPAPPATAASPSNLNHPAGQPGPSAGAGKGGGTPDGATTPPANTGEAEQPDSGRLSPTTKRRLTESFLAGHSPDSFASRVAALSRSNTITTPAQRKAAQTFDEILAAMQR
ncbi:hypothetical protein N656DRAFT_767371 [Canariomyces notabilis]|uniref:Uncharacterized protein n=1 Tax=Canariomyces notabilis TaxID=2074819 RepID=A0AAN6TH89_9PEZI|nr:hypothetical protein N656DRAFT_767371 [Canariomyces arenarius]